MTLIEKMRRARESSIDVDGIKLTIRRPTDMDALELSYHSTREAVLGVCQFVVGWSGVKELDLIPGGTGENVPFDAELFVEWIQDKPECWEPLIKAVRDSYQSYRQKVQDSLKN